jgi:serine/threonine protein kinase
MTVIPKDNTLVFPVHGCPDNPYFPSVVDRPISLVRHEYLFFDIQQIAKALSSVSDDGLVHTFKFPQTEPLRRCICIPCSEKGLYWIYRVQSSKCIEQRKEGSFKTARDVGFFALQLLKTEKSEEKQLLLLKNKGSLFPKSPIVHGETKIYNTEDRRSIVLPTKTHFDHEIAILKMFEGVDGVLQLVDHFTYISSRGRIRECMVVPKYSTDLENKILNGPIDKITMRRIQWNLLVALARIHKRGCIHRDIKPANILLDPFDNPVIADFGLATAPNIPNPVTGGTLTYLAPEAAYALYTNTAEIFKQTTTPAIDVFSLAIVFLEMDPSLAKPASLLLENPDKITLENRASLYTKSNPSPVDDSFIASFPSKEDPFQNLVAEMLANNPKERISSADAVKEMKKILQKEGIFPSSS